MNKYLALQKDVFDISKVTVVGSPTITSDGVASGFTLNDYIKKEQTLDLSKPFEIKTKIKTFTLDSQQAIFSFDNTGWNNYLTIHTNRITFWLCFNNVDVITLKIETPLQNNKEYYIDFSWNGNVYKLRVSEDGETWEEKSYNSSEVLYGYSSISKVIFGRLATYNYYSFTGSINLTQFKIYVDGELVFQPVKPTYLLERRKPMVWNRGQFTIVGNPSISDEGIASGFSGSDYIQINNVDFSRPWEIQASFKLNSINDLATPILKILGYNYGNVTFYNNNTKKFIQNFRINNADFIFEQNITININTNYIYIYGWDGEKYYIKLINNNIIIIDVKRDNTSPLDISDTKRNITLGVQLETYSSWGSLQGSINLKQFKIYTDNTLVFDGGAETYVYDPSKFTIVGSPTVTEYGVASGFSTSNYINLPIFNLSGGDFEIETLVDYTPTGVGQCFYRCATDTYLGAFGFVVGTYASNKLYIEGTTAAVTYDTALTAGKYLLRLVVKAGTANIYLNGNLVITGAYTKSISTAYITMGQGKNAVPFTGSMDLKAQSVKIRGKEVFTGTKENYYMLRR